MSCDDRYLGVEGARLRYRDEGRGSPVLLVHGWAMDLEVWDSQAQALRHAFRVVRFDRRGFGRSSGRPSLEEEARDIGVLCRLLQLERIALVAMSQGTRSAVGFAVAHPQRVSCLVLDGPPEFDSSIAGANVSLAPFRDLVRAQGLAAFRRQWLQHPLMQLRGADRATRERLERIIERYPGNDLFDAGPDASPPNLAPQLGALVMPTLVITGEHDLPARVAMAEALAGRLPAATRAVVPGSGHLSNLDNPEFYNQLIAAFIARHASAASK